MKIGWVADPHDPPGGAEYTQAELRAAAPDGAGIIDWDAELDPDLWVIHNCKTFPALENPAPKVRYMHDLDSQTIEGARHIFCSPQQRDFYDIEGELIPPPVDLAAFKLPRQQRRNDERKGTCSIASWANPRKGAHLIEEWGRANGEVVDVFGHGAFRPEGSGVNDGGPLERASVAQTLWRYERFVFLPTDLEPFGRCVTEAWAAGCEVITNDLVGAKWWLENEPEKLESAARDFWRVVLDA